MDVQMLTRFFMWCTILNMGFLLLLSLFLIINLDFVYKMQSKLFPMSRETFNVVLYSFIAIYKIIIFVFNLVPWITLSIIG